MCTYLLVVHIGTDVLSLDYLLEVAYHIHVEYVDGEVVLLAHGGSGEVHYLKPEVIDFVVGDFTGAMSDRRTFGANTLLLRTVWC